MCCITAYFMLFAGQSLHHEEMVGPIKIVVGKSLVCPVCGKRYTDSANVRRHVRQTHNYKPSTSNIKQYICSKCGRGYSKKWKYNAHFRDVHSKNVFECDLCDKKYSQKRSLVRHLHTSHGDGVQA